eukprot:GHVP01061269.1.p1 GENE.GHVP01061269.1~~GHVP01061269.1.p1  ORF type:complete len:339 (+),score=57.55 GHVP01061269.1:1965-2981(+)
MFKTRMRTVFLLGIIHRIMAEETQAPVLQPENKQEMENRGADNKNAAQSKPLYVQPYGGSDKVQIQNPNNVYFERRIDEDGIIRKSIPFDSVVYLSSTKNSLPFGLIPVPVEVEVMKKITVGRNIFFQQFLSYEQDVEKKAHMLTMRDAPGEDIDKYLNEIIREPLPEQAVKYILFQLVLAESYLLNNGVTHGDMCAKNVFIRPDTLSIKVIEFGMAQEGNPRPLGNPGLFQDHVAPERCNAKNSLSGEATEVFSLGVLAYKLFHRGKGPFQDAAAKLNGNMDAFACPDCSDLTKKTVERMLNKDPNKRPRMTELKDSEWLTVGEKMFINSFTQPQPA